MNKITLFLFALLYFSIHFTHCYFCTCNLMLMVKVKGESHNRVLVCMLSKSVLNGTKFCVVDQNAHLNWFDPGTSRKQIILESTMLFCVKQKNAFSCFSCYAVCRVRQSQGCWDGMYLVRAISSKIHNLMQKLYHQPLLFSCGKPWHI